MKKNYSLYSVNSFFKSIIIILFGISLLGSSAICLAQDSPWSPRADLNLARYQHGVCVVNGKIYAIGGEPHGNGCGSVSPATKSVEEYDPLTDTWDSTKSPMPTARESLGISSVNGKIYAIGGSRVLCDSIVNIVEEYDPVTDKWVRKEPMKVARRGLSTCVVNDTIYAVGGYDPSTDTFLKAVEAYDPITDTWTTKSYMHHGRSWFGLCVVDEKIYAMSGEGAYRSIEIYDPDTDIWEIFENEIPFEYTFASVYVDSLIYTIGGAHIESETTYPDVWSYNPRSRFWKSLTPMQREHGVEIVELNGLIYNIGGNTTWYPFTPSAMVDVYNPHNDLMVFIEKINTSFTRAGR